MLATLLLVFASILSNSTLAKLGNEQVDILFYAHTQAESRGIDPEKFIALINCESQVEKKARGDYQNETGKFLARGILQFWRKTFDKFSAKYDFDGRYENPYDQIFLAARMISDGFWFHWKNCGLKVGYNFKDPF